MVRPYKKNGHYYLILLVLIMLFKTEFYFQPHLELTPPLDLERVIKQDIFLQHQLDIDFLRTSVLAGLLI